MSVCDDVADYEWLTTSEAAELLCDLAASDAPLHTAVERLRGRFSAAQTHLVVEQLELRRRARAKFSAAHRMFFTRVGLEQSTDEHVARYKASRFNRQRAGSSATPAFADLCCGIGGDLLALAEQATVIGMDCNPNAVHFARHNVEAALAPEYAERTTIDVGDVEQFDLRSVTAWHIDPDRRAAGRRTTSLESCRPNRHAIERLLAVVPHAAVKLAPATEVPQEWRERCELEWISRGGECKQLVAWHGELAQTPGQHRATVVLCDGGAAVRTIVGEPGGCVPLAEKVDRYVFDVDSAVLAARLGGALAAELGLKALSAGATYLTGSAPAVDPLAACFEVEEVLPMKLRTVARLLRERHVGELEIKKRGVDIVPEKLRGELKLRGQNAATLLITPIAGRPTAILARRINGYI